MVYCDVTLTLNVADTITAMFKTNLRTEIPFDVLELFAFSAIG